MSTKAWVNQALGMCDDLIGGSSLMWRYHHQASRVAVDCVSGCLPACLQFGAPVQLLRECSFPPLLFPLACLPACPPAWLQVSHHIHCNDDALDEDVMSAFPLLRFDPRLPRAWYHRYQHIYMVGAAAAPVAACGGGCSCGGG